MRSSTSPYLEQPCHLFCGYKNTRRDARPRQTTGVLDLLDPTAFIETRPLYSNHVSASPMKACQRTSCRTKKNISFLVYLTSVHAPKKEKLQSPGMTVLHLRHSHARRARLFARNKRPCKSCTLSQGPSAHCLLFTVHCLLLTGYCLLFTRLYLK